MEIKSKTKNKIKELTKTKRITIVVILALLVIIIGFLTLKPTIYTFNTALDKELSELKSEEFQISPQTLAQAMIKKDQSLVLIDVRSQFEYAKSHLPEAINVYNVNLMQDENINLIKDITENNKTVVFYGNSATEANVPFMILKQMGVKNLKYLSVGYNFFISKSQEEMAGLTEKYEDEIAVTDFAQFISDAVSKSQAKNSEVNTKPMEAKPTVSKPKTLIVPKKVESGGDEGC